jgi:hypothetical protein
MRLVPVFEDPFYFALVSCGSIKPIKEAAAVVGAREARSAKKNN